LFKNSSYKVNYKECTQIVENYNEPINSNHNINQICGNTAFEKEEGHEISNAQKENFTPQNIA